MASRLDFGIGSKSSPTSLTMKRQRQGDVENAVPPTPPLSEAGGRDGDNGSVMGDEESLLSAPLSYKVAAKSATG
jgi:hypothetical protein